MREIKFRGKRKDNGVWVYGSLLQNEVWTVIIDEFIPDECGCCYDVDGYEVIPETVGQYTGLCDMDGTRIYEGDILRYNHSKSDSDDENCLDTRHYTRNYAVEWINTRCNNGYRIRNKSIWFMITQGTIINGKAEKIGNVYDNPELLEVGEC